MDCSFLICIVVGCDLVSFDSFAMVSTLDTCQSHRITIKAKSRQSISVIISTMRHVSLAMFKVFIVCVLFSQLIFDIHGQDVINGDCLDYPAFEYFRYSPSLGYDPLKGVDGPQCAQLCSESAMPNAGVVAKKYCLCARDTELEAIKSIPKVTNELCTQSDDYVSYFRGKSKNKIENLAVKPDKEVAVIDEEVYFELSSSNTDVEYSLDYGDGSDHTEWSSANALRHRYYMSGTFVINVHARTLTGKPKNVVSEMASIKIEGEVQNENVHMACPTVVEPGDLVDCNITVTVGTQLQMKMDFGDGVFTPMINLPGTNTITL